MHRRKAKDKLLEALGSQTPTSVQSYRVVVQEGEGIKRLKAEPGVLAIDGVFTVPKVSAAEINQGESLTWVVASSSFDDNAATGDITGSTAFAAEAAGDGVTSFAVKFTGVPGTVKA
ncbi:DUF2190 family protein [Microbulbifer sp. ZKSA006]|uniref:DUF2190 family protein n=1 Tax=Microbulbifer sp. ZKSA006 TaxID=3243390 RepID=UPI004039D184